MDSVKKDMQPNVQMWQSSRTEIHVTC